MGIEIGTINALKDNLCFLIMDSASQTAVVIDPSEAKPVFQAVAERRGMRLELILNTHHHADHVGGNQALSEHFKAPIYCSAFDQARIPEASRGLKDGEKFTAANVEFEVMNIPGHTSGQIAFYARKLDALFVGDTLFSMGCGRLYEGSPKEMFESLARIMRLPPETYLFFGHEYSARNGAFAKKVDPTNTTIDDRLAWARIEIKNHGYAIAPTLLSEMKVNPFLRTNSRAIRKTLGLEGASDLEVFTRLREMRNNF